MKPREGWQRPQSERPVLCRRSAKTDCAILTRFELVFLTVLGLTLIFLVVSVVLAVWAPPTAQVANIIDSCSSMYKLGFGAIVGLIGGKKL